MNLYLLHVAAYFIRDQTFKDERHFIKALASLSELNYARISMRKFFFYSVSCSPLLLYILEFILLNNARKKQ